MRTRRPSLSLRSRSCQVTSQRWSDALLSPHRQPPCRSPHTHTSAAGTLGAAMPACPGHWQCSWGPSGSLLRSRRAAGGLPTKPRDMPASLWAWQGPGGFSPSGQQGTPPSSPARWQPRCCQHRRTLLRPAGTPAPSLSQPLQEPGVPISAPSVPGSGAQPRFYAPYHPGGADGEALGRIRPSPALCPGAGRGGGRDAALQLCGECEQPPQILRCGPCYIRGLSRVTSAPQLASDLVSVATLSRPEGYRGGKPEGTVPEVTPCTTP